MIRTVRGIARGLAVIAITVVSYFALLVGKGLMLPSRKASDGWSRVIQRTWGRGLAAALGLRIVARGQAPRGAFFMVSNHLGYLDIVVYAALVDVVFVAKSEVARWPIVGLLCRSVNTIFIDRELMRDAARVGQRIEKSLSEGHGVMVFPEGTSTKGVSVLRFKPALLQQAARAGLGVYHAAISYRVPDSEPPAHLSVCWWGDMTFLGHLREMLELRRIDATVVFGDKPISATDRKTLAAELQRAVLAEFIPVVDEEGSCEASIR